MADKFKERAVRSFENSLTHNGFVGPLEFLAGMQLIDPVHFDAWKKGHRDFLQDTIQTGAKKMAQALEIFAQLVKERGLKATDGGYKRSTREGKVNLRFSREGDPEDERYFQARFVPADLPEKKQKAIAAKQERDADPVVFEILNDSECSECGVELESGSMLFMEGGKPLCLACARMDELEFLGAGDAALTRRAGKYSSRRAVVVRFSRSRGRYERQGILVEVPAIEKAERECAADAEQRAAARAADAARRKTQDRLLTKKMAERIGVLFPKCPVQEAAAIAAHTAARGSGRVGRTAGGRSLEDGPLTAAVTAAVRHNHTGYDQLLESGVNRDLAREQVWGRVRAILASWRAE